MGGAVRLTLASIFRDATDYIPRYFAQIKALRADADVRLVLAEGDSHDESYAMLKGLADSADTVIKVDHGGPKFGSIDDPQRWAQIALVCNDLMRHVGAPGDAFVYVESDLLWGPATILGLVSDLDEVPAVAPLSFCEGNPERFYDVWGFVKDGERFDAHPPYHPGVGKELTEIDSAGSCFATRPEWASVIAWSPVDCIRGVGRSLREAGASLWVDPLLAVHHP